MFMEQLSEGFQSCIHTQVAALLLDGDVKSIRLFDESPAVYQLPAPLASYYSVSAETGDAICFDRAIVRMDAGRATCTTCRRKLAHSCRHVQILEDGHVYEHPEIREDEESPPASERRPTWRQITPFTRLIQLSNTKVNCAVADSPTSFAPLERDCHCVAGARCTCGARCASCGSHWDFSHTVSGASGTVYWQDCQTSVTFLSVQCSMCSSVLEWDGLDNDIFRYSAESAITLDVVYDFLDSISIGQLTYTSFWNIRCGSYQRSNRPGGGFMNRSSFIELASEIIRCLESATYWAALATCPCCGDASTCKSLTFDATCAAPQRKHLRDEHLRERPLERDRPTRVGTFSSDRVFFPIEQVRKTIRTFSKSTEKVPIKLSDFRGAMEIDDVAKAFAMSMAATSADRIWVKNGHKKASCFLRDLSMMTSVFNGLIRCPHLVGPILQSWLDKGQMSQAGYVTIASFFPSMAGLLREIRVDNIPLGLKPILERLVEKCHLTISETERGADTREWRYVDPVDDLRRGCWLPGLPRERGFHSYRVSARDWEAFECHKDYGGKHCALLPGMVTFHCPHGFYLGKSSDLPIYLSLTLSKQASF